MVPVCSVLRCGILLRRAAVEVDRHPAVLVLVHHVGVLAVNHLQHADVAKRLPKQRLFRKCWVHHFDPVEVGKGCWECCLATDCRNGLGLVVVILESPDRLVGSLLMREGTTSPRATDRGPRPRWLQLYSP